MYKIIPIAALLTLLFSACSDQKKENVAVTAETGSVATGERPPLKLKVVRIEQEMFQNNTRKGILKVLDKYPSFSEKFLKRSNYPHDSLLVNAFYQLANNKSIDTIYNTCQEFYGDFSETGYQYQDAFDRIKLEFPKFTPPVIYTIITGMGNDMFISDSIIVVGLEFFLAEKSRYAPDFPKYIQRRYRKEYIVPMSLLMISNKYSETDYLDNSLVAEMVYYGKSYYFLEKMMPGLADTIISGYPAETITDVQKNQEVIWAHFVDKKLLFETRHEIVNRYIGERPATNEIGSKCPGRIGRWLGWQIVRRYMERNPDLSLADLMREKDARKIFNESKYKPKRVG